MTISIRELAGSLASGTVRLAGRDLPAVALAAGQTDRVLAACPRPAPAMIKDPDRGSAAPKIPDTQDAGYRARVEAWLRTIACVELCAACGIEVDGKLFDAVADAALPAWCDKATAALRGMLPATQIERAWNQLRDLIDEGRAREALIVPVSEGAALDVDAFKLPPRYGVTGAGEFLRICERYSIDPFRAAGVDHGHAGMWTLLRAQERIRVQEGIPAAVK